MRIRRPSIVLTGGILIILILTIAAGALARQLPFLGDHFISEAGRPVTIGPDSPQGQWTLLAFSGDDGRRIAYPSGNYHLSRRVTAELPPDVIARNDAFAKLALPGSVNMWLRSPDGRTTIVGRLVRSTPLSASFWKMIFTGLFGGIVGLWVGTLRPDVPAALALACSGCGLLIAAYPVGIILNNELLLSGTLWLNLMRGNYIGIQLFGGSIVFVFAVYPTKLMSHRVALGITGGLLLAMIAVALGNYPLMQRFTHHSRLVVTDFGLTVLFGAWQWIRTKRDPVGRAYLRLVGATAVLAMGGWIVTTIGPQLYGGRPLLDIASAALLMVLIYAAIALGIVRGYMFDVDRWAWTLLASAVTLIAIFAIEAGLVVGYGLDHGSAASVAFLFAGCCWLIARHRLLDRLMGYRRDDRGRLLGNAHRIVLADSPEERFARWQAALTAMFQPLEVLAVEEPIASAVLSDYGLSLHVPAPRFGRPLLLRSAQLGRSLFLRADCDLVEQFRILCDRIDDDRMAYDRGMRAERERIAKDLHDDVSGRLLTGLHREQTDLMRGDMRTALADLRTIVSGLQGQQLAIGSVLGDIRRECDDRLSAANIALHWQTTAGADAALSVIIEYAIYRTLIAILREVTTNVLRHSRASRMTVTVDVDDHQEFATVDICDDGVGLAAAGPGNGLHNIASRAALAGGTVDFPPGQGARITLGVPVRNAPVSGLGARPNELTYVQGDTREGERCEP